MLSQEQYRIFCNHAPPDFPVFMYDWYLDAVCVSGQWAAVHVQHNGELAGVWPYYLKQKLHWSFVAMPVLCKFMGPYILPKFRGTRTEHTLLQQLTDALPADLAAFEQDFPYAVTNWLPLFWKGFRQTTRYSYTLNLLQDSEQIWQNIAPNYRRKINKSQQILTIVQDRPLAELFRIGMMSFERQGLSNPFDLNYLRHLDAVLSQRGACQCFFAVDESDAIHSAAYLIWDQERAYYLFAGDDPALRKSGSAILLQWAAINYTRDVLKLPIFDFEGSMIQAVELGRRDFGAQQAPYFRVQKEWSPIWRWGKWLKGR